MIYYRMNPRYKKTSSGQTMTVILDLTNPDPTTWATYADDAVRMTAGSDAWDDFFGHYPCILDNGVELGKLKRDNFAQYEDGRTAPITTLGKDVMIAFPRRGIKIEYLDSDTLSVSMTTEEGKTGYSYMAHSYKGNSISKFYLGAYKGYVSSNKLYSISGYYPQGNLTIGDFRTDAHSRGTGYEQSGFFQLTFRQVMYLLKYKGQNAQVAVGRGYVDNNSYFHVTGGTNNSGMDYGTSNGAQQVKLFGIEDFYGNINEFIDGIYSNANRQLSASDGNFNDTGSGYTTVSSATSSSNWQYFMQYPVGTNLGGFLPLVDNTNAGDEYSYFCDTSAVFNNSLAFFGGNYVDGSQTGIFKTFIIRAASESRDGVGARLMYMHVAS